MMRNHHRRTSSGKRLGHGDANLAAPARDNRDLAL
jgi:hypothetical protein